MVENCDKFKIKLFFINLYTNFIQDSMFITSNNIVYSFGHLFKCQQFYFDMNIIYHNILIKCPHNHNLPIY